MATSLKLWYQMDEAVAENGGKITSLIWRSREEWAAGLRMHLPSNQYLPTSFLFKHQPTIPQTFQLIMPPSKSTPK
jgi:hypothetical protein